MMAGVINTLTNPVGVKLFKGGPYLDNGAGDRAQQNQDQYAAQVAQLVASIAQNAGIANPMDPNSTAATTDPYGLSNLQQASLNKTLSYDRQTMDAILNKAKADLAARGLYQSSDLPAMEAYLQQQLSVQTGAERVQAGENAYQNRVQAQQTISNLLNGLYTGQQNVTAQQGQTSAQSKGIAMDSLGSILGLFLGGKAAVPGAKGGLPSGGTPPIMGPGDSNLSDAGPSGLPGTGSFNIGQSGITGVNWGSIFGGL